MSVRAVAATCLFVVVIGVSACGSASPSGVSGSRIAVVRDARLVGTWKIAMASVRGAVTRADSRTYQYLVFAADGGLTLYENTITEKCRWTTANTRLVLVWPAGESRTYEAFGTSAALNISVAVGDLESSKGISYTVTRGALMLSGRSRMVQGNLESPTARPSSPASNDAVTLRYIHFDGPPPPPAG
jgi:hypothetical protein